MGWNMDNQVEVKISVTPKSVLVSFQSLDDGKFRTTLGEFKRIFPKARWDSSKKVWILPVSNLDNLFNFLRNIYDGDDYSHQLRLL